MFTGYLSSAGLPASVEAKGKQNTPPHFDASRSLYDACKRSLFGAGLMLGALFGSVSGAFAQVNPATCFTDPNGLTVSTTTGDVTWNTPHRVKGTVRVLAGATLTITGTTIEFDDTRNVVGALTVNNPSRIVVEPGGLLNVTNSTLTVLCPTPNSNCPSGCPDLVRMWDGITILGTPANLQSGVGQRDPGQGKATINGSRIENARIGLLMGTPSYGTTTKVLGVSAADTDGGGWALVGTTTFKNCHTGAYVTRYRPNGGINLTRFGTCTFLADAPLKDSFYGTGVPTQYGVRATDIGILGLISCTFELIDGTAAFGNALVPNAQRGFGVWGINNTYQVRTSTFRNLNVGVFSSNTDLAYTTFLEGNTFVGNIGGVYLSSVLGAIVKDNIFQIGRDAHLFPYGLSLNNSTAQRVTDNTFAAGPACLNGLCWTARGLNLSLSDGPELNEPIANSIYRNSFSNLSTGIYVQRGCSNTLLQCNSFRGPLRIAPNTISRADIEILIGGSATTANQFDVLRNRSYTGGPGLVTGHGECDAFDQKKAANNLFSYTTGAARSLLFINTAQFPTLVYNYSPALGNITQPLLVTAPSNPTSGGAVPNVCFLPSGQSFDYTTACPDPAGGGGGRPPGVLRALLATTTDFTERSTLLNELLRSFLHDTTLTHGVDSAITAVGTMEAPPTPTLMLACVCAPGIRRTRICVRLGAALTAPPTAKLPVFTTMCAPCWRPTTATPWPLRMRFAPTAASAQQCWPSPTTLPRGAPCRHRHI
jgi:hypothetical protein